MARNRQRAKARKARQQAQAGQGGQDAPKTPESAKPAAENGEADAAANDDVVEARAKPEPKAKAEATPAKSAPKAKAPRERGRFIGFLRSSWAELRRVQWPDRRQITTLTGVVIGFVIIAGAYLGVIDVVAKRLVDVII